MELAEGRRGRFVDVPHVRQSFNWDCGLACVLMVLRTLGVNRCGDICDLEMLCCTRRSVFYFLWGDSHFHMGAGVNRCGDICDLEMLCCTRSIWTVDLAYLLQKFSVEFSFFTVTLGANPDFSEKTFYSEQLQDDSCRVDELFQRALETGISIHCRSISGQEISVLILSGQYIAIALVDKVKLRETSLEDTCISDCYAESSDYTGHYVVVCGYDADTEEFEIRDPACLRKHERVSLDCFDEARKSSGTDEDILVVSLNGRDD